VLRGGFGTLDESFELFTLLQTGKAEPAPVVLLDLPGGTYWEAWERFLRDEVATRGLIADGDRAFWMRTDSVEAAADEILGFFSNYHSIRYVGDHLVVRLQRAPSPDQLKRLSDDFPDLAPPGGLVCGEPSPAERADNDHLDLARLVLRFDRLSNERLRLLINALNALDPAGGLAQA